VRLGKGRSHGVNHDFSAPENFLNRELSWLEFNQRVLEEAQDASQPLLERVKFLSIFSSNLDEFFEIRVAGIKQLISSDSNDCAADGIMPLDLLRQIQEKAHKLVDTQYALWCKEIKPALAKENIHILEVEELSAEQTVWARDYFRNELYPVLTPLSIDASHPFPQVLNKSHNLIVRTRKAGEEESVYSIVQIPRNAPRLVPVPQSEGDKARFCYVYLSSLIRHYVGELFPGLELECVHGFRVTRNSDLYIDEEEAENLLRTIEQELRKANRGLAVRLELNQGCPQDVQDYLMARFQVSQDDIFHLEYPISMTYLMALLSNEAFAKLKDRPFYPAHDPKLPEDCDLWHHLREHDVLLHHPYESFDSIVDLLESASTDPQVMAIKMTLYRTSGDSPLIAALAKAARDGKQVTAMVEIKARFDEAANIQWGRRLEEAGVHVVYGLVGLKTHCKMMLIVRRDEDRLRQYVHLGTGNYHPKTARLYTDLSLLTTHEEITHDVAALFNSLTGPADYPGSRLLLVAPFDMAERFRKMIERERDHALAGKKARIIIKINSLVDEAIIKSLYEASAAGVQIDLIVRGICCLRPGVPGVSENIRVVSIVGRFLEHSRVFYFSNAGEPVVYLGSSDWMPRNFYRRVEVAFPILDPVLRAEIVETLLPAYLNDRAKARELQPDGSYKRLKPRKGTKLFQAQFSFRESARRQTATQQKKPRPRLIPIKSAAGAKAK